MPVRARARMALLSTAHASLLPRLGTSLSSHRSFLRPRLLTASSSRWLLLLLLPSPLVRALFRQVVGVEIVEVGDVAVTPGAGSPSGFTVEAKDSVYSDASGLVKDENSVSSSLGKIGLPI